MSTAALPVAPHFTEAAERLGQAVRISVGRPDGSSPDAATSRG